MRIQSLCRTSRVVVWTLAVVISTATTGAQQPTASRAYSSGELRSILENQPDFTADGIASDLKNLVIRIESVIPGDGSLIELFPAEGVTMLRNVKLGAAAELFAVPKGFVKADRAGELSKKETQRQKRLHSADGAPQLSGVTVEPPVVRTA